MSMNSLQQLEDLKRDIIAKKICVSLSSQAKNLVMGDGNPDADIVFIGEAPGKKEDEEGLPFIGASGKFLNEMLAAANMERGDVYITNIVKYRPPKNRDPLTSEKQEFWPYLVRQLEIIHPKVIITLGRHSMECFLPGVKISEQHGNAEKIVLGETSFVVIPLYHPAAALYNGSLRQVLIDDFLSSVKLAHTIKN